jgi:iron complex outermembrane receptor protein
MIWLTSSIAALQQESVFRHGGISQPLRLQIAGRSESSDVTGTAANFPSLAYEEGASFTESPLAKTFIPKSASAGLLYDFGRNVIARMTAQHVDRAPDATELFYRGPHDSTATFEILPTTHKAKAPLRAALTQSRS